MARGPRWHAGREARGAGCVGLAVNLARSPVTPLALFPILIKLPGGNLAAISVVVKPPNVFYMFSSEPSRNRRTLQKIEACCQCLPGISGKRHVPAEVPPQAVLELPPPAQSANRKLLKAVLAELLFFHSERTGVLVALLFHCP